MTKIVSYALRSGMDPADAVKAFSGISCSHGRNTCLNAASAALKEVLDALPSEDSPNPASRAFILSYVPRKVGPKQPGKISGQLSRSEPVRVSATSASAIANASAFAKTAPATAAATASAPATAPRTGSIQHRLPACRKARQPGRRKNKRRTGQR